METREWGGAWKRGVGEQGVSSEMVGKRSRASTPASPSPRIPLSPCILVMERESGEAGDMEDE